MSSAISSVGSTSWVNSLFTKIDTKNQGYIDKSELQTALSQISSDDTSVDQVFSKLDADSDGKISESELSDGLQKLSDELNNQFNQSRLITASEDETGFSQAELTSMIEEIGDTDAKRTSLMQSIVDNFEAADTNGDGKVSNTEAMAYDQSVNGTGSASGADTGFTKEELTSMIEEIGDTDTKRTALMQSIIDNFETADADGDGKVSDTEAMSYDQSVNGTSMASAMPPPPPPSSASSTDSSTSYEAADTNQDGTVSLEELIAYQSDSGVSSSSEEMNVMKIMLQLVEAYGLSSDGSAQASSSNAISAIA